MRIQILKDVISYGKKKTIYATKGEKLQVLNQRGEILIIKGSKENFPIHQNEVKIL